VKRNVVIPKEEENIEAGENRSRWWKVQV
jgi:hypothetical protein